MKHQDEESVYEANFNIFRNLSPVITSLTQNWVKKDLNLYIMNQQSIGNFPVIIKVFLIFPDFNIFTASCMIYKLEYFWSNFGMMTLQHGARILRFLENSFINKYLTLKFFLFFIFIFLSPFVQQIPVWIFFRANFMLMTSQHWVKTSKFWKNGFIKK